MIRASTHGTKICASESRQVRFAGARACLFVLLSAAVFLLPVAAWAGHTPNKRETRHVERVVRHDVPHNARYKNPPRQESRYDGHGHNGARGGHERARYDDHRRGHYDNHRGYDRHDHDRHHYRTRVYREYVPYYAPVVVAYPYYCDLCHSGFYAEHVFYDHLFFAHHLSRALIPGLLYWSGGTFVFAGW